jgi:hypothetical protein
MMPVRHTQYRRGGILPPENPDSPISAQACFVNRAKLQITNRMDILEAVAKLLRPCYTGFKEPQTDVSDI